MIFFAALSLVATHWSIALSGDIMLNGVSPEKSPFVGVAHVFRSADTAFANLEVPMTDIGRPTARKTPKELKARTQFVLRANPAQMKWLRPAGIAAVSLGNNHAMDYGPDALAKELEGLDQFGVKHAGAGKDHLAASSVTVVVLPSGVRVGLTSGLAFIGAGALGKCTPATDTSPGVNGLNLGGKPTVDAVQQWVTAAHKRCDVLIVALHGGIERHPFPTSYQVQLAHAFIDAGADVVWGHHPHVLEGAELYKGHPILYSMGNLVSPTPAVGGVITLSFDGNSFLSAAFTPTVVSGGRVKRAAGKLRRTRYDAFMRLCAQTATKVRGDALPFSTN